MSAGIISVSLEGLKWSKRPAGGAGLSSGVPPSNPVIVLVAWLPVSQLLILEGVRSSHDEPFHPYTFETFECNVWLEESSSVLKMKT